MQKRQAAGQRVPFSISELSRRLPTFAERVLPVTRTLDFIGIFLVLGTWACTTGAESKDEIMKGKLAPCPSSPNCVSSLSENSRSAIRPLFFSSSMADVQKSIRELIQSMPGALITHDEPGYIHAEFSSKFFKFVDDVEFVLDGETQRIDYRSASRIGYYDFGANRRRLDTIRNRLVRSAEISTDPLTPNRPRGIS
jgi:uncharacterized protein (DUF1499 family)